MNPWFMWKILRDANQKCNDFEKAILGIVCIIASVAAIWIAIK